MEMVTVNAQGALDTFAVLYRIGFWYLYDTIVGGSTWKLAVVYAPSIALLTFSSALLACVMRMLAAQERARKLAFVAECRVNMYPAELIMCDVRDGFASDPERARFAYLQAKDVFDQARARGYGIKDLGYTYAEFDRMVFHLRERSGMVDAANLAPAASPRHAFVPVYDEDGVLTLVYQYAYLPPVPRPTLHRVDKSVPPDAYDDMGIAAE